MVNRIIECCSHPGCFTLTKHGLCAEHTRGAAEPACPRCGRRLSAPAEAVCEVCRDRAAAEVGTAA